MMRIDNRKGSALLIVLGMLSFMVVSAVGFSIYMRQSRAPSSYLSRNVSSRYLVKAALANAIEELDGGFMSRYDIGIDKNNNPDIGYFLGIGDDPYPGVGSQSAETVSQATDQRTGQQIGFTRNGNYWFKRVFCPFGLLNYPRNVSDAIDNTPETVPTMTLEALAYLPPAIIDDVRKLSRVTRTAQWKSLPYEAGRYAYTAVNVSDLFDINRLRAGVPRNSGRDRITLATLTSDTPTDPSAVDAGRADSLDTILDKVDNMKIGGNVVPFTSLADFNLAALGSSYAPLMKYIGTSAGQLPQANEAANALFITDTWFPTTNAVGSTTIELGGVDGPGQPFLSANFTARSFLQVLGKVNSANNVGSIFEKNLGIGLACLYDYLDSDSVPVSLALPTTEAVPMVVGVSAPVGISPSVGNIGAQLNGTFQVQGYYLDSDGNRIAAPVTIQRTCQQMGLDSFGNNVVVQCLACYPFKRMATSKRIKAGDFKVRGILRVWLAPAGMGCRPTNDAILQPLKADIAGISGSSGLAKDGVATFVSDSFTAGTAFNQFATDVTKTEDAIQPFTLQFRNLSIQMPFYWEVTEQIVQNMAGQTLMADSSLYAAQPYQALGNLKNVTTSLRPLDVNGSVHGDWSAAANAAQFNPNGPYPTAVTPLTALATKYRLYAAVWVQVLDKSGNVVDMVPASLTDDNEWLNAGMPLNNALFNKTGGGAPLLNFMSATDIPFDNTLTTTLAAAPSFAAWSSLYAVDPRYNWAPEDWYAKTAATVGKNDWMGDLGLTGSSSPLLGQNGRDRDIFMFVSDQEYLQSIGELQFLPVVSVMDGNDSMMTGAFSPNYNGNAFSTRTSPTTGTFANGDRFWRTYSAYEHQQNPLTVSIGSRSVVVPDDIDPYHMVYSGNDVSFTSSSGTFKVNPYTEDDRILAAAFVGTPYDYYVASTNENQRQAGGTQNQLLRNNQLELSTMKSTYGFGSSNLATLDGNLLLDLMDEFRTAFQRSAQGGTVRPWDELWNDLEWQNVANANINENNTTFLGTALPAGSSSYLHGVDRKYLYSYWYDCFANQQQLFLVFVRAEPTSVGGGATGRVAAGQLGGRAVALVWRDPNVPTGGGTRPNRSSITTRDGFRDFKRDGAPHRTRVLFYHQFD